MWWNMFTIMERQRKLEDTLIEMHQEVCKHEYISHFQTANHSENRAGHDLFKVEYCLKCRKHISRTMTDFVPYSKNSLG